MSPRLLTVATALFFAGSQGLWKRFAAGHPARRVVFATFAGALPLVLAAGLAGGLVPPRAGFFPALAGTVTINFFAQLLLVRALANAPISVVSPFLAFTPVFITGTAWVVVGEPPGLSGVLGSVLVAVGAYFLHAPGGGRSGLFGPLREAFASKGSRLALLVAFLWSFTASLDKRAVNASSPLTYLVLYHVIYAAVMGVTLVPDLRSHAAALRREWRPFMLLGLFQGATLLCQMQAIAVLPVQHVIAVKRASALVAVLLGAVLFREREAFARLPGAALMVLGAGVILVA